MHLASRKPQSRTISGTFGLATICLIAALCSFNGLAWAVQDDLTWTRNAELDMSHYNLYLCPVGEDPCLGGVLHDKFEQVDCDATSNVCLWTDIIQIGMEGTAIITAVDVSRNESARSNTVPFDRKAPFPVLDLLVR